MDQVNTVFLRSLGCALKGISLEEDPGLSQQEWQAFFRLAGAHHVFPLVFEAVRPLLQDSPLLSGGKQAVRQQVFLQTQKSDAFLRLLKELHAAGVHPLVVKGIVCRSLYPKPDHRFSSDEDLLILPEDLAACQKVFARFGLSTDLSPEDQARDYEIPYRQKDGVLYIELHKHLFPPESASYGHLNRFFQDAAARAVRLEIPGGEVWSLGHTDHLFYLICHALKHFLHSGFGIRQVCDILMYTQAYRSAIDWPLFLENCRQIRALPFTAAIFRIGQNHLGFGPEVCPAPLAEIAVDEMPMLEDLLQAGVYGTASDSRLHSSSITLEAAASQQQARSARNSLALSLFPPARQLEGRYPWLKDRPWLLPAAWASRMGSYCRKTLTHGDGAADPLKIGSQRIRLLTYYGILDSKTL